MRDLQQGGRSTVHGVNGAAATSQPAATLAAIEILKAGGNAVDAAVAACAVQCVVEPMSTGIGGDCFALLALNGKAPVIGFNGSGRAPRALTLDWFRRQGVSEIQANSTGAVTVPGAVDAWAQLVEAHGRMDLGRVLEPAIRCAEDGFVVGPRCAYEWHKDSAILSVEGRRHYLRDGAAPRVGTVMKLPALAETLKTIAAQGRDGFYRGWVADDLVASLAAHGGVMRHEDLEQHRGQVVTPISADYRGRTVHQIPPNGQGLTALLILNILQGFELSGLDPLGPERMHLEAEATRLAWQCRDALIADPERGDVPVERLLSEAQARRMQAAIDRKAAHPPARLPDVASANTVYLTVVDRDRNVVSFINSLFDHFGSGFCGARSGVLLQNRGCGFVLEEGHPNVVAGGKRPLHTIIPGMVTQGDRAVLGYGVMGGFFQPVGHAHVLTNWIDFGLDIQQAIDMPRGFHHGDVYSLEKGVPAATAEALAALGHRTARSAEPMGGGQGIVIDWEAGTLSAGSDPRKDGCALAY
ncbi:gamma-glutamyltransferase [Zavarzinia sp. CC-PAN008]|uniref:gamma-glutamyltransferase n=1 Tax=Zavarzinia sp. CC-PAN008 TaxID=3243332 RepID=UPI003F743BA8